MRLRLLDRVRRSRWRRGAGQAERSGTTQPPMTQRPPATPGSVGSHRRVGGGRSGLPGPPGPGPPGPGKAGPGPAGPPAAEQPVTRQRQGAGHALPRRWGLARVATRAAPRAAPRPGPEPAAGAKPGRTARAAAKPPWYEIARSNRTAAGRRHCGHIESLVHREWAEDVIPPPEVVRAIDRLAELPHLIKVKLAAGLDAIHIGSGGVPDLDDMGRLHGVPLPSGRATWDACAGAYGERKIIVGSRPSPTPDVMCHEIGHALDDLDGTDEEWQSDSAEFRALYDQCLPAMASAFHRQPGVLGRREFFADAFAAIASHQRPALVEMLSGDTRAALNVMLYFNVRYGI
jgi:hypothetical protein